MPMIKNHRRQKIYSGFDTLPKGKASESITGRTALKYNRGIIGFDFIFHRCSDLRKFDFEHFYNPEKRFVAVATG